MGKDFDVSVIIINYNSSGYTVECVKSVLEKTSSTISAEIIIVDNNSRPEDYSALELRLAKQDNIRLVRSRINIGFGAGNMLGAQFAQGQYLLFLNNDTLLMNDCLSIHIDFHKNHPEAGVTSAQNFNEQGKAVPSFDHNKGIRKLIFGRSFLEKYYPATHPKRKSIPTDTIRTDFINGAFMFFKSRHFGLVGGFDTNIFLYFEEMDISHRLLRNGLKTYLLPQSQIVHFQGASSVKSVAMNREGLISYLYVIKKNYPYLKFLFIKYYLLFTFFLKPKKWDTIGTVLRSVNLDESLKQKQVFTN
ncbi:glycosyl transferase [Flavobacterium cyanobacteriorum]|uniref:Glycosyl transferase n=1 Tax=Flavobacterium cyanobacteriorum TaxID=2022802 RepID=A0A255YZP0_9FLAO|nr:glycosyltransferase family 2 protein [Flavobacterium cyanobacteriorum]OYQ34668.1 glycosyl transferase [Flavobacterium cyanobacteriorum]